MKETEQIRKAEKKDIDAVAAIYAHIHEQERTGKATIGWLPGIYPVRGTAEAALAQENGCTVLRILRQTDGVTRVVILSARSEVEVKVAVLDAVANDYLA